MPPARTSRVRHHGVMLLPYFCFLHKFDFLVPAFRPKTAQHLLGHADIQTTMNIYTDFSNRMNTSALGKLDSFLTTI